MTIRYIIVNAGGYSTAAINRCNALISGLSYHGSNALITLIGNNQHKLSHFQKLLFGIKYLFRICYILLTAKRGDVLIFYGHFPYLAFIKFFKKKGIKLIAERNEFPSHIALDKSIQSRYTVLRSRKYCQNLKLFDGFITCSTNLRSYYQNFTRKECKFLIIPSVLDISRFENQDLTTQYNYITYCGDWSNSKDGVSILIEAFFIFHKQHEDYKLRLIGGSSNKKEELKILNQINDMNICENVIVEGRVPYEKIPGMLCEAKILALARPDNKQAEGGFPSKLTEYLATGIPTLVTRVGEIDLYFENEINIHFSNPTDPIDFANKLCQIVNDYDKACQIAKKGKVRNEEFSHENQGIRLLKFVQSIHN